MKKEWIILLIFILFSKAVSASLGVSPAIIDINFVPGEEYEFRFTIISDDPEKNIVVYAEGDLAKYVTLSKTELTGPGNVLVTLKLPQEIKEPGIYGIAIGAREKPAEDAFISAVIDIRGVIRIHVPYPGKYPEVRFKMEDGNLNDLIPVEVYVINKGKEDLNLNVNVGFFDDLGTMIYNIPFRNVILTPTNEKYFQKYLNTTGFKPGTYVAEAVIEYGETVKKNSTFRIGSLFVNITNFTTQLPKRSIQKFFIDIESMWNGDLQDVYADVNISNSTKSIEFRTPSIGLERWKKKTLTGFLDTNELDGEYETKVILYYAGERSFASGRLLILRSGLNLEFLIIGMFAILFIIIIIFIIWKIKKSAFKLNIRIRK